MIGKTTRIFSAKCEKKKYFWKKCRNTDVSADQLNKKITVVKPFLIHPSRYGSTDGTVLGWAFPVIASDDVNTNNK